MKGSEGMSRTIDIEDMEYLAVGAAILATGGGGDPFLGKLMAQKAIEENGPVTLLDPSEVKDDDLVIPTAMMGAPTVFFEKIPNGDEALHSLNQLEKYLGKKAYATMPIECGGLNSTIPFVVAAKANMPIVDGDGMGRAFPELQMETFNVYGVSGSPAIITDESGNWTILNTTNNAMLERVARSVAVSMGGVGHIAEYPMSGSEMKKTSIHHTISLAIDLGKSIMLANEKKQNPLVAMEEVLEASSYGKPHVLFEGKIIDVDRRTESGFTSGNVLVQGMDDYENQELKVEFQNENLIAYKDSEIIATVPDLITFLDTETFQPITTEALRYGFRVTCIGIPTPEIMRTPEALEIWGPEYFGYKTSFIPLEERNNK